MRILQISPVSGQTRATIKIVDKDGEIYERRVSVTCLALVENEDGGTVIEPMVCRSSGEFIAIRRFDGFLSIDERMKPYC